MSVEPEKGIGPREWGHHAITAGNLVFADIILEHLGLVPDLLFVSMSAGIGLYVIAIAIRYRHRWFY